VGDSAQRDPELYGALARKYPEQVRHIFIRSVTDDAVQGERYQSAFQSLPQSKWTVFTSAQELPATLP
jgi:phosphatidate phosphatase APP1